jgi:hypothetical protein
LHGLIACTVPLVNGGTKAKCEDGVWLGLEISFVSCSKRIIPLIDTKEMLQNTI